MSTTAVGFCPKCTAVVNVRWKVCFVCQAILPPAPEVPASSESTPYNWSRTRDLHGTPGLPVDLLDGDAVRLLAKKPDTVRPVLQAGDQVEWLSPALPPQRGEVLAVHSDGTFEVFHPLTEALCRLPVTWVTKILKPSVSPFTHSLGYGHNRSMRGQSIA